MYYDSIDKVYLNEDRGTYVALGLAADYEGFIADAEWITYEVEDALVPDTQAYYITLGYRVGPTVIYGTYSREKGDEPTYLTGGMPDYSQFLQRIKEDPEFANPQYAPLAAGAEGLVEGSDQFKSILNATKVDIVNMHIGVRWDFHPSAALKFAYEIEDNKISEEDGGVFRTAIDFVF